MKSIRFSLISFSLIAMFAHGQQGEKESPQPSPPAAVVLSSEAAKQAEAKAVETELTEDLKKRLDELPEERRKLHRGDLLDDAGINEADDLTHMMVQYWRPVVIELMSREMGVIEMEAEKRLDLVLDLAADLGNAKVMAEYGIYSALRVHPESEARLEAIENLVVRYVFLNSNDPLDVNWWEKWLTSWNDGVRPVPQPVQGQWTAVPGFGVNFAHARIENHHCTVIWQEKEGDSVQKIDFSVHRVSDGRFYTGENDYGMPYSLGGTEFEPVLTFDVPSNGEKSESVSLKMQPDW